MKTSLTLALSLVLPVLASLSVAPTARAEPESEVEATRRPPLEAVAYVDPARYVGTWYQIARKPVIFEFGCVCSIQKLKPTPDNRIEVSNSCRFQSPDGHVMGIHGYASSEDTKSNAKYAVDFGLPWKGQYWIIALDDDYRWAVVSDPARRSLYVLSKTPTLSPELYRDALAKAAPQVDTSVLQLTRQEGCSYAP